MQQFAVEGSLARWQRLILILGLLVAVWAPVHSAEVAVADHPADGLASPHDAADAMWDEPGGRDEHRCGHRDVEREATHAISVRLAHPGGVTAAPEPLPGDPRPALADPAGPRTPPGTALQVKVCVWQQ